MHSANLQTLYCFERSRLASHNGVSHRHRHYRIPALLSALLIFS